MPKGPTADEIKNLCPLPGQSTNSHKKHDMASFCYIAQKEN